MQDLTISLVQSNQFWEDKTANLVSFSTEIERIPFTQLILLPEMFNTSFTMNTAGLAENWENSSSVLWLKKQAVKKQAAIYTSLIIKEDDCFYNRGVFIFPNGDLKFYDKRKLFTLAKEDEHFSPGSKELILNYLGWNINLQICYDLRFPEQVRNRLISSKKAAYDLLLYVANWPEKRTLHWKILLQSRAIENQCFVAGLNRVGNDANSLNYSGDSNVYCPLGLALFEKTTNKIQTFTSTISYKSITEIREKINFLKDIK